MAAWEAPGFVALVVGPDGKPIREFNEEGKRTVRVPFGTEYKLRFKNKTNARAYVRVEIDGMDALSGKKLIMEPNCSKDLERFLEGDNSRGRKFQFVTAGSAGVSDPTSGENGLVRVIFEPESVPVVTTVLSSSGFTTTASLGGWSGGGILRGMSIGSSAPNSSYMVNSVSPTSGGATFASSSLNIGVPANVQDAATKHYIDSMNMPKTDAGATAAGSESSQQFLDTNEYFPTLLPVTLDLWIRGPKVETPRPADTVIVDGVLYKRA